MKGNMSEKNCGILNILLTGGSFNGSLADNLCEYYSKSNKLEFNIVEDIEMDDKSSNSWFNEFIYGFSRMPIGNNIIIANGFRKWMMKDNNDIEKSYMKMLFKAMNVIVVDTSNDIKMKVLDHDIPHLKFNIETTDFIRDLYDWIDFYIGKIRPKESSIKLIRSLSGSRVSYLGDVFGCFSNKKYENIIVANDMRHDVPILFDEFCHLMRGKSIDEIEKSIVVRSNSASSVFFK